jgi:hypothetical protein
MQQAIFLLISIPVLYLGALYSDVRQYVRQLDTSAERHDMATRAASIGVWEWDPRTDDLFIQPHLKRLLGYTIRTLQTAPTHGCNTIILKISTRSYSRHALACAATPLRLKSNTE